MISEERARTTLLVLVAKIEIVAGIMRDLRTVGIDNVSLESNLRAARESLQDAIGDIEHDLDILRRE